MLKNLLHRVDKTITTTLVSCVYLLVLYFVLHVAIQGPNNVIYFRQANVFGLVVEDDLSMRVKGISSSFTFD